MNKKFIFAALACCMLILAAIVAADSGTGSIRVLYTNDAGAIRNVSPAPNAEVYRDNQYLGTTDDSGYLFFDMNRASMGKHTFNASVAIGSGYYYGSMVKDVQPDTKDFAMVLKKGF
jgi:hypothetical protein